MREKLITEVSSIENETLIEFILNLTYHIIQKKVGYQIMDNKENLIKAIISNLEKLNIHFLKAVLAYTNKLVE